ncbi:MAG TPA: NAD-dependent epimerase/dehydratase family protein [Gemmatimonadaceae bacterium]|nr:NAD-dependent epimerase/dehydratase family protein [Gemmatimonadaceae bacterium]
MNEAELDELLSTPRAETVEALRNCPGDIVVLGAGGKMGPTLARMAARAAAQVGDARRIFAVSRFSSPETARVLGSSGIETIACDLLDREAVAALPDAPNVIFMAGQKFGTDAAPETTWAMNTLVPAICAERYRGARIVAFSTGNVYPLTAVAAGGAREGDPVGPVGEYASSALGRERVFEFFSDRYHTCVSIIRLNYAIDLRYGVLADIGLRVWREEPVPLAMGHVNVIWQGDANRIAIESLALASTPPFVVNVTGIDTLSVRNIGHAFAAAFGKPVLFRGAESTDALLSNTDRMRASFAPPDVSLERMIEWIADWIRQGGPMFGKPTHFEERSGKF